MKNAFGFVLGSLGLALSSLAAAEHPKAGITNGIVQAELYLPDAQAGFYRGTRFDWSGVISSLKCHGHTYFGQWFTRYDPAIRDVEYDPANKGYAAGTASASMGPVEEFTGPGDEALGFSDAPAGGTFLKIGVGVLRKQQEQEYDHYAPYEIVDAGKWSVHTGENSVEFVQEAGNGVYAYIYRKTVRLSPDKPELVLEHSLRNTGRRPIETSVYNHNFFVIDRQPSGPDFTITFPFELRATQPMEGDAEVRGKQVRYLKVFENDDRAYTGLEGFGNDPNDYDFRVENRKTGAGVRVRGDQPLESFYFWTIARVLSPEAYNHMKIAPGEESTWKVTYEFYTLAGAGAP